MRGNPAPAAPEGIVILGCPRSGTTLLRRLLDAHPAIAAPGETYLLTAAARFLEGERMVDGLEVGVVNGLGFLGFSPDEVVGRLREFVFSFRREHAAREGKRLWLEKTAVDAFHLDTITRLCGDRVHYLCVVRHGLDVVCSMQDWVVKSQAYPAELHRFIRETPRPLEAFARAWVEATAAIVALAEGNGGHATLIRYEDLVADPDATMARVLADVGEGFDPAAIGQALANREAKGFSDWKTFSMAAIEAASIGRHRRQLSADTAGWLAGIVGPLLAHLGYEVPGAGPGRDAEALRRRYLAGLALQGLR